MLLTSIIDIQCRARDMGPIYIDKCCMDCPEMEAAFQAVGVGKYEIDMYNMMRYGFCEAGCRELVNMKHSKN